MKTLVLLMMLISAANINGTWKGTTGTVKGDYPISFTFKVNGSTVEGTMLGTDGTPFPIEDGKIDGNNVSFTVKLNYPGKSFSRSYKGVVNGDEIHFTADTSGSISEFVVKRAQ